MGVELQATSAADPLTMVALTTVSFSKTLSASKTSFTCLILEPNSVR